jgi:hypothetical protein
VKDLLNSLGIFSQFHSKSTYSCVTRLYSSTISDHCWRLVALPNLRVSLDDLITVTSLHIYSLHLGEKYFIECFRYYYR